MTCNLKNCAFLIGLSLFLSQVLLGQCPDRKERENLIHYIRDSSKVQPSSKQLQKLLPYRSILAECPPDSIRVRLLRQLGVTSYKLRDFEHAVQYAREAIDLINTNIQNPAIKPSAKATCYSNLLFYYDSLNMPGQRLAAIDSSLALGLQYQYFDKDVIYAIEQKVQHLIDIGELQGSLTFCETGEKLVKKYSRGTDSLEASVYFQLQEMNVYFQEKNYDQVEKLMANMIEKCKRAGALDNLGVIYDMMGQIYSHRSDPVNASKFFRLGFQYELQNHFYANARGIAYDLAHFVYYLLNHSRSKAMQGYRAALAIQDDFGDPGQDKMRKVDVLVTMAGLYTEMKQFDSTHIYFKKAFSVIRNGSDERNLLNTPLDEFKGPEKVDILTNLIAEKADSYLQEYQFNGSGEAIREAKSTYRTVAQFVDKLRAEQVELGSKLFWRQNARRIFEHAIEASLLSNSQQDAFYFFEKSRAAILNDDLRKLGSVTRKELDDIARTRRKILQLNHGLETGGDTSSARWINIQSELILEKQKLDVLEERLAKLDPLYYQDYMDTTLTAYASVHQILNGSNSSLVEIFDGDSAMYVLLMTNKGDNLTKVNKHEYDSLVSVYNSIISSPDANNSQYDLFKNVSNRLYRLIFKDHPLPDGRLVVSPDGPYFPMEALVTGEGPGGEYLIMKHSVSYTYSFRYWMSKFGSASSETSANFLGMAPLDCKAPVALATLTGSDHSLQNISSRFGQSDELIGGMASRNEFVREFGKYKIVQLYTHASDSSSRGEPVIYFSDSPLYLSDLIPEARPSTQLIVLSACQTGIGKWEKGEGVFGFNRGFASMGIPASVSTLWEVDNKEMYKFTELFYQYLAAGMPTDSALREAKLEFLRNGSRKEQLPYYWAASILAGKPEIISIVKPFPWNIVVEVSLIVAAILAFYLLWSSLKEVQKRTIVTKQMMPINPTPDTEEIPA